MTSATLNPSLDQDSTGQDSNVPFPAVVGDRSMLDNPAVESDRSLALAAPTSELSKLPYDKAHQLELLHLRAEAEALLQQLQIEKQRKLVTAGS